MNLKEAYTNYLEEVPSVVKMDIGPSPALLWAATDVTSPREGNPGAIFSSHAKAIEWLEEQFKAGLVHEEWLNAIRIRKSGRDLEKIARGEP